MLRQARIDVAFLALHGRYGEDGCIQGLLELLGIPYTGSGVLASALAMNKGRPRRSSASTTCRPRPATSSSRTAARTLLELHGSFGFPVVVKPAGEGSSLGIRIARDELELEAAVEEALRFDDDVLVERFVEGKEISVGILDGKPLGAVEIVAQARLLRLPQQVHERPHRLPPAGAAVARALPLGAAAGDAGARRARLRGRDARRPHRQRAAATRSCWR